MPEIPDIPISSFPDAESITNADKVTGLQGNENKNFTFSSILAWFVNAVKSAFVPVNRTVNGKTLDTNITLNASDVGAQAAITALGILKGNGAGGVSAAVAGTDYGTYSKPSGGIPSSDMTSAVQTSLGKADSAYQKPSGGIPASDLANGVIPSVPSAYTSNPAMDSTASPGSAGAWARGDHVHPSDTSKANETELGAVETGPNASINFAAGDLFSLNGVYCRAKTAISSGAAFTLNTNYEETTVAKQFRSTKMFYLSKESGTTSSLGNLNLALNPNAIVVGFRPSQSQAVSFFGRGSNGNYFAHMVNSSGSNITNTAVTLDVYYIL